MTVTRSFRFLLTCGLVLAALQTARAQPAPSPTPEPATEPEAPPGEAPAPAPRGTARPAPRSQAAIERDQIRREVLDEVRRELDRTKEEIRDEVSYVESEADARNYDARELRELKQSVNFLQLHGYFRGRGDLFHNADLGRGPDPTGATLFPDPQGTDFLGTANFRLRLNPVLRISDDIAVYAQIDVLDNIVAGANPLQEPFFDATTTAPVLQNRIGGAPVSVKRVWAEIDTLFGQIAFGRKEAHFGLGMVYNDGNCLDCDYGTTFDRVQLTFGPFLGRHLVTAAVDVLGSGATTADSASLALYGNYAQPFDLQRLDDAYRFSLQFGRVTPPEVVRERLARGEWVLDYGLLAAYRTQGYQDPGFTRVGEAKTQPDGLSKIDAQLFEGDVFAQFLWRKLRLGTEWAIFGGSIENRLAGGQAISQSLDLLQWAGVVRAQYSFLKQDSLLAQIDVGVASGDKAPGMGSRPGRPGSGPDGNTERGDIDGRQFNCTAAGCSDNTINNFRMNPDFRIDQILWRNIYVTITDAAFARAEVRFKPGGRASGGGDDHGFEFSGAAIYSQALYSESTPQGGSSPLGIELDAAVTYTSPDRFFAGVIAGFLFPLEGLNGPGDRDASLAQVYRLILGTTF